MPFPIEFHKCPICRSRETVCRQACADEPSIPKGTFVSLEKVFTPIQDMNKITTPLITVVICHYDVCANCGHRFCTRAEKTTIPVTIEHRSGSAIKTLGVPR